MVGYYWQLLINILKKFLKKPNLSGWFKLKLVITYHLKFVVKT